MVSEYDPARTTRDDYWLEVKLRNGNIWTVEYRTKDTHRPGYAEPRYTVQVSEGLHIYHIAFYGRGIPDPRRLRQLAAHAAARAQEYRTGSYGR